MATSRSGKRPAAQDRTRQGLQELRRGLLDLHRALIEAERLTYERIFGRVASNGQLLQLVMDDPWFTWLHPLSQLVVRIDELLDSDTAGPTFARDILTETQDLLRPSQEGDGWGRSYYEALQRAPDVVIAHSQVKQLLHSATSVAAA
ncbi:MAG: hypothetical protein U0172_03020 [Nitrospiraceae bacterium]